MNYRIFILAFQLLSVQLSAESIERGNPRLFVFSDSLYFEQLTLHSNGKFNWSSRSHGIKRFAHGNWQRRGGDSIILDSNPQRDRMIVIESYKKSSKCNFLVLDKANAAFSFHIKLVVDRDTINLRNQIHKIALKGRVRAFQITDSDGITSPFYTVRGQYTNRFVVYFERIRIFENESWQIVDGGIVPLGNDGKMASYILSDTE